MVFVDTTHYVLHIYHTITMPWRVYKLCSLVSVAVCRSICLSKSVFYRYMVVICNACVAQTHTALTTKRWCRRSFCAAAAVAAAVICVVNVDALANTIAVSVCVVLCMDAWIFYSSANLPSKQMHNTPHAVFDEPRKLAVGRAPHKIQARIIVDSAISVCMLCSVVRSKCMSFHSRGYASIVLTGKWYTHTHTQSSLIHFFCQCLLLLLVLLNLSYRSNQKLTRLYRNKCYTYILYIHTYIPTYIYIYLFQKCTIYMRVYRI